MNPAQQARFAEIWTAALDHYKTTCGTDLTVTKLPDPANLEAFRQDIENNQSHFKEYRKIRGTLWKSLSNILLPIEMLGPAASQGAVAAFQASPAIMAAFNILIKGARGVSQSYDYIQELFDDIGPILSRLHIHSRKDISAELRGVYTEILACVLEIIGVSTKYIMEGRAKRFLKRLLKPDESRASELKDQLQRLVGRESSLVCALNLEATGTVLEKAALTGTTINKIDLKIEDVSESVKQISKQLGTRKSRTLPDAGSKSDSLKKIKDVLDPQMGVENDLDNLKYLSGTGDWVLTEPLTKAWIEGYIPLLRLSGGPGAGKSHLSRLIIDTLRDMQKKTPDDISIGYFFFKGNDPMRDSFTIALRTIAYQIALSYPVYLNYLKNICESPDHIASLTGVWRNLFRAFLTSKLKSSIYIVLDGVDEAQRDQLVLFLTLLKELCGEENRNPRKVNVLVVGRWDIDWYLDEVFDDPVPCVDVSSHKNREDIIKYVSHRVEKSRNLKKVSSELRTEIITTLTTQADGMFLWVDLMLKEISTKNREATIRTSLQNLPKGLPETYKRMFHTFSDALVDEPDQIEDLNELLMWVGFSNRPLSLAELECILEARYNNGGGIIDLHEELRKKYASFFTITDSSKEGQNDTPIQGGNDPASLDTHVELSMRQKRSSTVRLRHASLGDFLRLETSKETPVGLAADSVHVHLFKTCARFMIDPERMPKIDTQFCLVESFEHTDPYIPESMRQDLIDGSPKLIFASYALRNWLTHLKKIRIETTSEKDKMEIIGYIHQIFTKQHILAARLQNYSRPYKAMKEEFIIRRFETDSEWFAMKGDKVETVLSWIRSQPNIEEGTEELRKWVHGVLKNQSPLLIYPLVREAYCLALGGRSECATISQEVQRFLKLISIFLSAFQPLSLLGGWFATPFQPGFDKLCSGVHNNSTGRNPHFHNLRKVSGILELVPLEKNKIWYLSAAHILYNTGHFDAAQEYCVKAASLTKATENYLRAQIYHLRATCSKFSARITESATALRLCKIATELAVKEMDRGSTPPEGLQLINFHAWSFDKYKAGVILWDHAGLMAQCGQNDEVRESSRRAVQLGLVPEFDADTEIPSWTYMPKEMYPNIVATGSDIRPKGSFHIYWTFETQHVMLACWLRLRQGELDKSELDQIVGILSKFLIESSTWTYTEIESYQAFPILNPSCKRKRGYGLARCFINRKSLR